jgi:hypothetical protein
LPARLLPAARAAFDAVRDAEPGADLAAAVVGAVRRAYRDAPVSLPRDDLDDMLVRINQYAAAAAHH